MERIFPCFPAIGSSFDEPRRDCLPRESARLYGTVVRGVHDMTSQSLQAYRMTCALDSERSASGKESDIGPWLRDDCRMGTC